MKVSLFSIILLFVIFSCNKSDFKTTDTGLEYKFIVENKDSAKVSVGDIVIMDLKYTTENDSVLFDSKQESINFRMKIKESNYDASIDEALLMMHIGDSAIFKINAMEFYVLSRGFKTAPNFIKPNEKLIFYVRIKSKMDLNKFKKVKEQFKVSKKQEEIDLLEDFLQKENITTKKDSTGIYFIEETIGKGEFPQSGDTVIINYIGKFVNAQIFDTSYKGKGPLSFVYGKKQLIDGLEAGIGKMKKGGKAKIIIPSELAYGSEGLGPIPPYATLIFEVEIVDIK
jgi:FKBP-type peptidyl-prolyl cis-trans isomerase